MIPALSPACIAVFLPQLLMSADAAKIAFAVLKESLKGEADPQKKEKQLYIALHRCPDDPFRRHVFSQVNNFEAVILQEHFHDILSEQGRSQGAKAPGGADVEISLSDAIVKGLKEEAHHPVQTPYRSLTSRRASSVVFAPAGSELMVMASTSIMISFLWIPYFPASSIILPAMSARPYILDVNVGLPDIDEPSVMKEAIREIQSVTSLPL